MSTTEPKGPGEDSPRTFARVASVLGVVAIYSFAGWTYIAANAVVHPETLHWPLTHLSPWPHEDTSAVVCFVTSFVAAVGRAVIRSQAKP